MKLAWNKIIRFAGIVVISSFVTFGVLGWLIFFGIPYRWAAVLAIIPALTFLEWYFVLWAKDRFDMYVETVGTSKSTYVRIGSENFLVPLGQELVIRQSDTEPGKLEVFTGQVER